MLWVSNRVADCQAAFNALRRSTTASNIPGDNYAFCYHSRFKLEDRKDRHKELIKAFQDAVKDGAKPRAILGATTQVCEMSLDLDAEILVTELAPIAVPDPADGTLQPRLEEDEGPPDRPGLRPPARARQGEALREGGPRRRRRSSWTRSTAATSRRTTWNSSTKQCDPGEVEPEKLCPFLDSGPYAEGKEESFRDIDEFTVPCILDDDEARRESSRRSEPKESIDGYIVPVPRWFATEPRSRSISTSRAGSRIAEMSRYDDRIGFDGRPRTDPSSNGGQDT